MKTRVLVLGFGLVEREPISTISQTSIQTSLDGWSNGYVRFATTKQRRISRNKSRGKKGNEGKNLGLTAEKVRVVNPPIVGAT